MHQNLQHPLAHLLLILHGGVSGNLDFPAARAFGAQARPIHFQLAILQKYLARLPTIEDDLGGSPFALLRRTSGGLHRRQLQNGLDGGSSGDVDQLAAGQLALLDQIHHGQKPLPILDQEAGQLLFVGFPLLAYRMVSFLHGGSPFKVSQPDSFRIRLDRRSTFNYSRDILVENAPITRSH